MTSPLFFKEQSKYTYKYSISKPNFYLFDMELGDSFYGLRNFVKGRITKYELEGIDPTIDSIREDSKNKAQSTIILQFDSFEKFGKMIGLSEDDIFFYQMVTSPYQTYEIYDSYGVEDDFKQGYGPWYDFNDENKDLANQIAKYYFNTVLDWNDNDAMGEFGTKLDKFFPRSVDNIVSDWVHEKNYEMNKVGREYVEKELDGYLSDFGLELYGQDSIKTTVADLVSLYLQFGVPHLSIYKLFKEVFKNSNRNIGGWDEDRYEYQNDDYFDKDSFNRTVEKELENILGELEDDNDEDSLKDYVKMVDSITNKYRPGNWYSLPKDDELNFKILNFDRKDGKIELSLKRKGSPNIKTFGVSQDGFYKLLYQPELFRLEI
jgi:hypothetical protein